MADTPEKLRVDKWLWHARFFKSRSLASEVVTSGKMRVNGTHVAKASFGVKPDDVLTFAKAGHIRLIRIDALGTRRGPAPEAEALYTDLDPPQPNKPEETPAEPRRELGAGRPTKRERRQIDTLRGRSS